MSEKQGKSSSSFRYYLLGFALLLYIVVSVFQSGSAISALRYTGTVALQVLPIFGLVLLFMVVIDYYLTPERISDWIGHSSGIKGWVIVITGGILSHGPTFVWYSLLQELKDKGM